MHLHRGAKGSGSGWGCTCVAMLFEKKLCMFVLCTLAAAAAALPPLRRAPAAFSLPAITLAAGGAAPSAPSASSGSSAP